MIWAGFAIVTLLVIGYLILPLMREGEDGAADTLGVYREAMDAAQSDEERAEIEARVLAAASTTGGASRPFSAQAAALVTVFVALSVFGGGLGLYAYIGAPGQEGRPIATIVGPERTAMQADDMENASLSELAGQLSEKLRSQGDAAPAEGWDLLARTYLQLGRYSDAADAFEMAAARNPSDPEPLMGAGEALVFSAGGQVSDRAYGLFSDALLLDPRHAGSRYYSALYDFQRGRVRDAYDGFVALYNDSDDGAPWMAALIARLEEVATASGQPLPEKLVERVAQARRNADAAGQAAPGPTAEDMANAAEMSDDDRMGMIKGMVAGLAERLESEPDDLDGWTRLARAYKVLGDVQGYTDATANIARLSPNDSAAQTAFGEALINATGNDQVPDAAMAAFDRALMIDPNNLQARYYRGLGAASRGDKVAARADLQMVLDALPVDAPVRDGVAAALEDLGD